MAPKRSSSSYNVTAFPFTVFAHLVAVAVVTLVLVWLLHFQHGFAFKSDNKDKIFNLHPLLMVLGFVLISGEAIMAYKTVPPIKKSQKLFHLILHFIALIAGIVGIIAVFKYHNEIQLPHMFSFHSWLGMSTICLFGLQWIFSFFTFFYPRAQQSTRWRLAPWHAVLGTIIFSMVILSALSGLVEHTLVLQLLQGQEALIVNFTGLLIFLFAVSVCLSVLLPRTL